MRILIALLALFIASPALAHTGAAAHAHDGASTVDPEAGDVRVGGPFTLIDQNGRHVTEKDFLGKYMLVTFGFTFCPDICPTEIQNALSALDLLGPEAAAKTNVVFITIDPARDNPARLAEYVRQFGGNLTALTGTAEQIAAVAKEYKIYYAKNAETDAGDDQYMMDHSSFMYLMGPDGKFVSVFRAATDPQEIADALKKAMAAR